MTQFSTTSTSSSATSPHNCALDALDVDIYENETELLLLADAPGLTPDQLSVELEWPLLNIFVNTPGEGKSSRSIHRQCKLDVAVDEAKISAQAKDGELSVRIPKALSAVPKQIPVNSA